MQLFQKTTLRGKIFLLFGSLGVLGIAWLTLTRLYGLPGVDEGEIRTITSYEQQMLSLQADSKKTMLEQWLNGCSAQLKRFIARNSQDGILHEVTAAQQHNDGDSRALTIFQQRCKQFLKSSFPQLDNIFYVSTSTSTSEIATSALSVAKLTHGNSTVFAEVVKRSLHSPTTIVVTVLHDREHGHCSVVFGQAVYLEPHDKKVENRVAQDQQRQPSGVMLAKTQTVHFFDSILHDVDGLGRSAEVIVTAEDGTIISHPKYGYSQETTQLWSRDSSAPQRIDVPHGDEQIMVRGYDYRQRKVLAAIRYINIDAQHRWIMVVKQDWGEIQRNIDHINHVAYITAIVGLVLLLLLVYFIAHHLTQPLEKLSKAAKKVSGGDLSARCEVVGSREAINLALVFNHMVERMAEWRQQSEAEVARKTMTLQRANADLEKTERQRTSISDISNCYLRSGDVDRALKLLLERTLRFTGAAVGRFRSVDEDAFGGLFFKPITHAIMAQHFDQQGREALSTALEKYARKYKTWYDSQLERVVREQKVFIFNEEPALIFHHGDAADSDLVTSMMLIPVYEKEHVYGVITLINKPGGFVAADEVGVQAFASVAVLIMAADKREQQRLAAEESTRIKGEFLATMSHELRTPMNVVIGMTSLLMDTALSPQQLDYMQKVSTSARQLLALISDILDVSKLEAGHKLSLQYSTFDLEQVLQSVVSLHTYSLDETEVELHVDISRAVPCQLVGDPKRLEQVLSNLLGNAIKFTPQGDILLSVDVEQQSDESDEDHIALKFRVKDSGIGISTEEQEHLFKPFHQVDSSTTRKHGGTGLGLTISRQLCHLMGGDLAVESTLGAGSTFYFTLLFKVPENANLQRQLLPAEDLIGISVLVVDDNKLGRRIVSQLLKRMQFKVAVAETAAMALDAVRTARQAGKPFPLLIVDNVMPETGGLELIGKIRAEHLSQAPCLLLVSANNHLNSELVEQAGVSAVVDKPVQASPLFNAIMEVFGYAISLKAVNDSCCHWRDVKLLVVEDVELNRQVVRDLLRKVGIDCSEAINGEVALEMVRHQTYDLVLMDIQMPIMDGFEATRQIRQLAHCAADELPILAMSADAMKQDRQDSRASGMNGHIAKPIDPDNLYQHLQRWLPKHKQVIISVPQAVPETEESGLFRVNLPSVDTASGLRYAGGNRQQYLRHLYGFADQLSEALALLPDELLHNKQKALNRVHTLKGLAGTVGAIPLQKLARKLEIQLSNGEQVLALQPLLSLAAQLRAACVELQSAEESSANGSLQGDTDQKPQGSSAELLAILEQLSPALENLQARLSNETVAKLRQKSWPAALVNDIDKLTQLVGGYRYLLALEVVRRLQQKISKSASGANTQQP